MDQPAPRVRFLFFMVTCWWWSGHDGGDARVETEGITCLERAKRHGAASRVRTMGEDEAVLE